MLIWFLPLCGVCTLYSIIRIFGEPFENFGELWFEVSSLGSTDPVSAEDKSKKKERKAKENPLLMEINKLSAQVSELVSVKGEIKELQNQMSSINSQIPKQYQTRNNVDQSFRNNADQNYRRQRRRIFKCEKCERDRSRFCEHCFECGASGHRRNECPSKNA